MISILREYGIAATLDNVLRVVADFALALPAHTGVGPGSMGYLAQMRRLSYIVLCNIGKRRQSRARVLRSRLQTLCSARQLRTITRHDTLVYAWVAMLAYDIGLGASRMQVAAFMVELGRLVEVHCYAVHILVLLARSRYPGVDCGDWTVTDCPPHARACRNAHGSVSYLDDWPWLPPMTTTWDTLLRIRCSRSTVRAVMKTYVKRAALDMPVPITFARADVHSHAESHVLMQQLRDEWPRWYATVCAARGVHDVEPDKQHAADFPRRESRRVRTTRYNWLCLVTECKFAASMIGASALLGGVATLFSTNRTRLTFARNMCGASYSLGNICGLLATAVIADDVAYRWRAQRTVNAVHVAVVAVSVPINAVMLMDTITTMHSGKILALSGWLQVNPRSIAGLWLRTKHGGL